MYAVVKVMRGLFGYNTPKKTDKRFCKTLDEAKEYLRKSYVEMIAREEEVKDIHIVYAYLQGKDIDSTAVVFFTKTEKGKPKEKHHYSWSIEKADVPYTLETLPRLPFEIRMGDSRVCVMAATPRYVVLSTTDAQFVCLTYEELAQYKFPDGNPCVHIHHTK